MSQTFTAIPTRANSDRITASWFNILRTAGVDLESGSGASPTWVKYSFSHTDFQTAATTNNSAVLTLAAMQMIHAVILKPTTLFAGTGITAYDVEVGISGNTDKYLNSFDLTQAVAGNTFATKSTSPAPENFGSTTSIIASVTSTGANLDQSTGGAFDVYVFLSTLPT